MRFQCKDYEPIPLNAVVVKEWDNQIPLRDRQVVFITNIDVKDPFITFDRYDDRSLTENKLFREVKQNWHFEYPPKKTKPAWPDPKYPGYPRI